jgi:hypothetical protein
MADDVCCAQPPLVGADNFLGVNMANRDAPRGLFRYGVGVLILIVIALIIYVVARGATTPGPRATIDSTVVPKVRP